VALQCSPLSSLNCCTFVFQGHSDASVFEAGLQAFINLSSAVGPALNPHLKLLLPSVSFVLENIHKHNIAANVIRILVSSVIQKGA
jgi:hypothetical protein